MRPYPVGSYYRRSVRSWCVLLVGVLVATLALPAAAAPDPATTDQAVEGIPRAVEGLDVARSAPGADRRNGGNGLAPVGEVPTHARGAVQVAPNARVSYDADRSTPGRASRVGTVYADANDDTDLVAQALTEQRVRHLIVLHSADAPQEHRFNLDLDGPADVTLTDEGGVLAVDPETGFDLLYIEPPWAEDANGREVPTHFELDGDVLVQIVKHHEMRAAYPVVADPTYACGIVTCTMYLNRSETQAVARNAPGATTFCLVYAVPALVAGCMGVILSYAAYAQGSLDRGQCMFLRHPSGVPAFWPGRHSGWRC